MKASNGQEITATSLLPKGPTIADAIREAMEIGRMAGLEEAAPGLLAAAARLIEDWGDGMPPHVDPMLWRNLRAAVAKATEGDLDE